MVEEDIRVIQALYLTKVMSEAIYKKIDDNEYAGKISSCWVL